MSRLFAISDIHGCFKPFYELVINRINLKKSDRLILLGDYIDRGEQSREVVDFIMDLKKNGFNITPLTGNHEVMLVDSYNDPKMLPLWLMNNGITTLLSFNINDISEMEDKYLSFFTHMEHYVSAGNFLFVHAGFNDLITDPFSDRYHMIWECSASYNNPLLSGKTIIHGHRPKRLDFVRKQISNKSGVIPIDTGCVYEKEMGYGFLSALEVNTMELTTVTCDQ
jgi:serine/threonine protein phosphatase 1